ncbi:MAG TPA: preprotein translocase subunit YajC [Planctomycetota bacterium]|nr:preprotein translocase subunit YajC [Planctomycetota bacterium]
MLYWIRNLTLVCCLTMSAATAADQPAPAPAPAPAAAPAPAGPAAPVAGPAAPAQPVAGTPADPSAAGTVPPSSNGSVATPPPQPGEQHQAGLMDSLGTLIPMLAIFGFFFYFMLIRPEQRRRKEHDNMLATIKKGAQVLTASGLYGTVQDVQGDAVLITIDEKNKVTVKMQKAYVQAVIGANGQPANATSAALPAADKK